MIYSGDCLSVMAGMEANSIDAIVTDPPYGLEFMGKDWDTLGKMMTHRPSGSPHARSASVSLRRGSNPTCRKCGGLKSLNSEGSGGRKKCRCENPEFPVINEKEGRAHQDWHYAWAVESLRVAKPGCYLLAFGGTRTFHRLACAIEDAGWEIRDTLGWLYGSGFPKSHDVSKAIDKARRRDFIEAALRIGIKLPSRSVDDWTKENHAPGERWWNEFKSSLPQETWKTIEREVVGKDTKARTVGSKSALPTMGAEVEYQTWDITAPATDAARQWDGWGTALKPAWEPIIMARKPLEGTVAANVQKWGTGAINVDGCRVPHMSTDDREESERKNQHAGYRNPDSNRQSYGGGFGPRTDYHADAGRWPANLLHDGSEEVLELFPESNISGTAKLGKINKAGRAIFGGCTQGYESKMPNDSGSAARFFYCAKASRREREMGCEGMPLKDGPSDNYGTKAVNLTRNDLGPNEVKKAANAHPCVKPLALMRYLCRLVTPPHGVILDPFMGSGTTGMAAKAEGFEFIGIEKEAEYVTIAEARIEAAL